MNLNSFKGLLTIVAVIIIIGLVLRYGKSAIDLVKAGSSGIYQETSLLTLQNTRNGNYPYYGP
jgi:hypothetical protein